MLPHPPAGPQRRRLVALCIAGFVALVAGIVVGAGGDDGKPKSAIAKTRPPAQAVAKAKGLSLARQIGEVVVIAFPGTTAPEYVRRALRTGRAAGVILFRGNAPNQAVTRSLTRSLQKAAHHRALIAIDQEGGTIRILPWAAPRLAQANIPTPSLARSEARQASSDL